MEIHSGTGIFSYLKNGHIQDPAWALAPEKGKEMARAKGNQLLTIPSHINLLHGGKTRKRNDLMI